MASNESPEGAAAVAVKEEDQGSPFVSDDEKDDDKPRSPVEICELELDQEDVDLVHSGLKDIEVLKPLVKLETVGLRRNRITCIGDNLTQSAATIRELDLYDNSVESIEASVEALANLEILDYSFNRIRSLENLSLPNLLRLFMVCNKVSTIQGLEDVPKLKVLELGANRLRRITGLDSVPMLDQLYLGKNKISKLENVSMLTNLTTLSLQSNRIQKIEGLECLVNLDALYLSHNGIEKLEGLEKNVKLTTIDLANNRISKIENVAHLQMLEEFWFNHNKVESWEDVKELKSPKLQTVYLEGNPVAKDPAYRRKLKLALPTLTQIDATMCA